ncbi:MAG: pirin family protein [Betaproteobacteria bacterium]|nr:pirin family protein [Betaproteobacteria bacterium]
MRKIERIIQSHIAPVGTFTVRRALPDHARKSVGPWVFLDHFGPFRVKPGEDGVGPHPHAGIETVTYLLSGRQQHRDSAGHVGIVAAGGAQWMTAGRGIIHAEAPQAENEAEMTLQGIQLWTTLPRAMKSMAPRYQRIAAEDIVEHTIAGGSVRVVAGEFAGAKGPADALMPLLLWHVRLAPGAVFAGDIPPGQEIAAYVINGSGSFSANAQMVAIGSLVVYTDEVGAIEFSNSGREALDVLLLGGAPAEGPLVFHGPFVMNSIEQVRAAEKAYMTGQMGFLAETA